MASRFQIERLAELIVDGDRDSALQLLHEMHPGAAPWPHHVIRRVADRRAEPAARVE